MTNERERFNLKAQFVGSNSKAEAKTIINRLPMKSLPIWADGYLHINPSLVASSSLPTDNCDRQVEINSKNVKKFSNKKNETHKNTYQHDTFNNRNSSDRKSIFTMKSEHHDIDKRRRVRFFVALLGLAIAVVNCYAQATFCISIVEMVLPADFVFKADNGQSIVKVLTITNGTSPQVSRASTIAADTGFGLLEENSCPVEYRYRDYYDSWRFPTTTPTNLTDEQPSNQPQSQAASNVIDVSNRFDWDASRQGLLLGAFAAGTAPLQVLGGRLAEIYGAKWVLLAGCIGTALTNLTIPFLAHFSFILLTVNRVIMGIAQAGMEPGLMCLLAEWLTPAETGFFISMLLFAICIGFFLGSLCSSFLLTLGFGWAITYYVAAGINFLVALIWFIYASSRPSESKLISADELYYIEHEQRVARIVTTKEDMNGGNSSSSNYDSQGYHNDTHKDLNTSSWRRSISPTLMTKADQDVNIKRPSMQTIAVTIKDDQLNSVAPTPAVLAHQAAGITYGQAPWRNILSTPSVWAFIVCKISIRWCADVLSIELPTYLANVLHLSIKLNGILNSVSSALLAIFSFITGYLVNEILIQQQERELAISSIPQENQQQKKTIFNRGFKISKTNLRKVIQSIASFGSAITLFLMTRYDCNILFSMSMLLILSCTLVMGTGGELQIPYDMTSKYPGTLHGMACTLSVSGWLAPPLIGLILGDQPSSRYRWGIVWYLTALINIVGGLVFVLFGDARPRNFDRDRARQQRTDPAAGTTRTEVATTTTIIAPPATANDFMDNNGDDGGADANYRGRHLTSYYNKVCKSTDSSPTNLTRHKHHGVDGDDGDDAHNDNGDPDDYGGRGRGEIRLNSEASLYFDRELIRIRQVEGSVIEPKYLQCHDSVARNATIMFPYQTVLAKQQQNKIPESRRPTSRAALKDGARCRQRRQPEQLYYLHSRGGDYDDDDKEQATTRTTPVCLLKQNIVWRLWTRARRRRKKFVVEVGQCEAGQREQQSALQQQKRSCQRHSVPGSFSLVRPGVLPHNGDNNDDNNDNNGECEHVDRVKHSTANAISACDNNNQQLALEEVITRTLLPMATKTITHL